MKINSTYNFFDLVLFGELGELDIDNYIQNVTDNHNKGKLAKLLYDIEYCQFCDREERNGNFSDEEIQDAMSAFARRNIELPFDIFEPMINKKGETISKGGKLLNLEKLLYPYKYFPIYALIAKIKHHIKENETPLPPQLATKLTTDQLEKLFDSLVNGEFIPVTTNKDCFNWAFGIPDKKQPKKKWQPIVWLKNKQLLRELLISFKNSEFIIADIERIVPLLFTDVKAKPYKLAQNRTVPSLDSDLIVEITKKIATV